MIKTGGAILLALSLTGCAVLDWVIREAQPPTPTNCRAEPCPDGFECNQHGLCIPAPTPEPTIPVPIPTVEPSLPPSPLPTPSPSPSPSDRYCSLAPGARNWPLMPGSDKLPSEGGVCPSCWGDHPELIVTNCGIRLKSVQSRNDGNGRRYVFDVTCHSDAPRCPHRPDQRNCDVLWGCQPPEPAMYQTGPGFELARVDRVSHNPYLGQIHISNPIENGSYEVWACPPGIRPDGPDNERCGVWRGYVGTDGPLSE